MQQPEFTLEIFSGPLDLLLHLIAKNKISIYDIPIAMILDQYMEYLDKMKAFNVDVASAFVEMAAHLLYLKSKMLLPKDDEPEEEDPRDSLVRALLEYQALQTTTPYFQEQNKEWSDIFVKPPEELEKRTYVVDHSVSYLLAAINRLLDRQERTRPVDAAAFSEIVKKESVPVSSKVAQILGLLLDKPTISLFDIYKENQTKSEFVAVFLALLELCKTNRILLQEEEDDLVISLGQGGGALPSDFPEGDGEYS